MFRQVLQAITPWLSLKEGIEQWAKISVDLAEPRRKRASQEEKLLDAEEEME